MATNYSSEDLENKEYCTGSWLGQNFLVKTQVYDLYVTLCYILFKIEDNCSNIGLTVSGLISEDQVQSVLFDSRVWLGLLILERCLDLTRLFVSGLVCYILP
jgi:hypothetical protein